MVEAQNILNTLKVILNNKIINLQREQKELNFDQSNLKAETLLEIKKTKYTEYIEYEAMISTYRNIGFAIKELEIDSK